MLRCGWQNIFATDVVCASSTIIQNTISNTVKCHWQVTDNNLIGVFQLAFDACCFYFDHGWYRLFQQCQIILSGCATEECERKATRKRCTIYAHAMWADVNSCIETGSARVKRILIEYVQFCHTSKSLYPVWYY